MDSHLVLMLPVFNRGPKTASFINYFQETVRPYATCEVVIFNDGCTDDTINIAQKRCTGIQVINLPGNEYWGGSLNHIKAYVMTYRVDRNKKVYFVVANDDIEYISKRGLVNAIKLVNDENIICAWGISKTHRTQSKSLDINRLSEMRSSLYYNPKSGKFTQNSSGAILLYSSWSMLATQKAWIAAPEIPKCIPHYLSDYWLLVSLANNGFSIKTVPGFGVYFDSAIEKRSIFEQISKMNCKSSYYYLPARIKFLSQWSQPTVLVYIRIKSLEILYQMIKVVEYFKRWPKKDNS